MLVHRFMHHGRRGRHNHAARMDMRARGACATSMRDACLQDHMHNEQCIDLIHASNWFRNQARCGVRSQQEIRESEAHTPMAAKAVQGYSCTQQPSMQALARIAHHGASACPKAGAWSQVRWASASCPCRCRAPLAARDSSYSACGGGGHGALALWLAAKSCTEGNTGAKPNGPAATEPSTTRGITNSSSFMKHTQRGAH